jgi:hypothetical protein
MTIFRLLIIRRRCVALVAAVATAGGVMTGATGAPASASTTAAVQTSASATAAVPASNMVSGVPASSMPSAVQAPKMFPALCLSNAHSYCLGIGPVEAGLLAAFLYDVLNRVAGVIIKTVSKEPNGDDDDEIEDDNGFGLCLADTGQSSGVDANWQACGANGTVWVVVPHTDGDYLYSRFALNRGKSLVLTSNGLGNGIPLFVAAPTGPGGAYWQTWAA